MCERNCSSCRGLKNRVEMVAPDMSGVVDYCTKGVMITNKEREEGCGFYGESFISKLINAGTTGLEEE